MADGFRVLNAGRLISVVFSFTASFQKLEEACASRSGAERKFRR
jgi:hypothetical protein